MTGTSSDFFCPSGRHILVAGDDRPLANFLRRKLEADSYTVDIANDGDRTNEAVHKNRYDLLLLDLNLAHTDGVSLLKNLRPTKPRLPILALTSGTAVEDRVLWLQSGADDCMPKPFSMLELMARIEALLRRNSGAVPKISQVADLTLDRESWKVERNGRRIDLTPREFAVLEFMMRNAGTLLSRAAIMQEVWNIPFDPSTNVVDVYVKYVRDKVDGKDEKKLVRTIRGVGYLLSDE